MRKIAAFFAAALASAACLADAGTVIYTETDMTASGDWEVSVAAGESNVVNVAQSGAGRIVKTGAGTLVLTRNSAFTGGVEIREGAVLVDPALSEGASGTVNCTALGSGAVTVCAQTDSFQGYCELGIVGAGSNDTRVVTVANAINVTGTSSGTYPALVIYGQNAVLTGKITAAADFVFIDDLNSTTAISKSQYNRWQKVQSCTFGEIEAAGSVGFSGVCRMVFAGKVKTPKLDLCIRRERRPGDYDGSNQNNMHGALVFQAVNEIGEIVDANRPIYCAGENVLPGVLFRIPKLPGRLQLSTFAYLRMESYDGTKYSQTIGGLSSDTLEDGEVVNERLAYDWRVKGYNTLTISGVAPEDGADSLELSTSASLNDTMSLVVDAYDGFTQTVSNHVHTMTGSITVKKGAFRVAGTAQFTSVKAVSVSAGASLRIDSTNADPFPSLASASVDGELTVTDAAAGCDLLKDVDLRLGANATLSLPQSAATTQTVRTVSFGGKPVAVGIHAPGSLPFMVGGAALRVLSVSDGFCVDATWSGAAEGDNLMSNAGNWQGAPEELDLDSGTLTVTIAGDGEEMVYADGTVIDSLKFLRTPASTPFAIRPATKGASLTVAGEISITNSAQLILSGTIATPDHEDQGEPSIHGGRTMTIYPVKNPVIEECRATNNVYLAKNGPSLPVVLDNAVIEKPIWSRGQGVSGFGLFYCLPNTTNEIRGTFFHETWWPFFQVDEGAVLTFSGGMGAKIMMRKECKGTMVIRDKPLTSTSHFGVRNGRLVLDAENFSLRGSGSGEGIMLECDDGPATIECRRSCCFDGDCALMMYGDNYPGVVEFNSTTQRVTRLAATKSVKGTQMRGGPGSLLEVVGGRTDMDFSQKKGMNLLTNRVDIAGALSFRLSATNETMTFYSQAFSTTGGLEVAAGTLRFASDATWPNGRDVSVNGEGRIRLDAGGAFSRQAELSLDGGGVFELPAGERQCFQAVYTNGVAVSAGQYTSLSNGDGDFLAGGGTLVVRARGTLISIR